MGTIKRNCPHCYAKSMAFRSFAAQLVDNRWFTALQCNGCHGGYFVEVEDNTHTNPHDYKGDIPSCKYFRIVNEYPRKVEKETPKYLPENIENFYSQSIFALRGDNYDSSAIMSRKVLEVSVKKIHPEGEGNLYKRIEALADQGIITRELKDWAHIIRQEGNESAHEEEPVTKEFAESIQSFTELFLLYVFTMPGMVKIKKPQSVDD